MTRIITKFISNKTKSLSINFNDVDKFSDNDTYYFYDTQLVEEMQQLINDKGEPKYVVNDHMTKFDFGQQRSKFYGFPLALESMVNLFDKKDFVDDQLVTDCCFNFMINKKQINRYLLIKLVEWFKLHNYKYTWRGTDREENLAKILLEIDSVEQPWNTVELKTFLLQPITIKENFIPFKQDNIDFKKVNSPTNFYGGNKWTWDNVLNSMFNHSAVSIITESTGYQRAAAYTEKTVYSILGLTFPIWVGGMWQAEELKRIGFDVFDDIIDHSYQYCETLYERSFRAVHDNLDILSNLELAKKLRKDCYTRLLNNRELMLSGAVTKFINDEFAKLPADLTNIIEFIENSWHRGNTKQTMNNAVVLEILTQTQ